MHIVLQRVLSASVSTVANGATTLTASIERGLCLYVGISTGDTKTVAQERAREVLEAKLFDSPDGKPWQASAPSCGLSLLVISNFTLAGVPGNAGRPDFRAAMKAADARPIFDEFLAELRRLYRPEKVLAGEFGAYMRVKTENDGPVTMTLGQAQPQAPPVPGKNEGEVSAKQKKTPAAAGGATAAPAAVARHAPAPPPGKTFAKRDALQSIEQAQQALWRRERIFERDAPLTIASDASARNKFMATFPYPYMNGRLHLGHAYTYSKAEFATAFQRLMGKDTLLPFAYHCTGMPIKVCADRLLKEMREFGNPPVFPEDAVGGEAEGDDEKPQPAAVSAAAPGSSARADPTVHHGKKSKASSKSVAGEVRQWKIMRQLGLESDAEIAKFADASHWLKHFPPLAEQDLSLLGAGIDWRRAFITTDANPYYDSFVRWQFEVLRQRRKVLFGKRFTIWSPHDNQACMDHERSSGEGTGPQEYVGIKIEVPRASQPPRLAAVVPAEERVFLVAATLRPETMIGQTNVWLRPDLDYIAWRAQKNEVFITTARAARNFSFQYVTREFGKVDVLGTFRGAELLGMQVLAPLSAYAGGVYTLPMETIDAHKGTGVVTSVPAESPADYLALEALRGSAAAREKHGVREHMVLPFAPVAVITTPEYGTLSAKVVLEQLGLVGGSGDNKDTAALLAEAHDRVYKSGFHKGSMLVGPHAGTPVRDAKPAMREAMVAAGQAVTYAEPAERVVSRSGDECVVCLADQWYIDYGEAAWRAQTLKALERVEMYSEEARNQMVASLNWLTQWACSRTYGLGTRLPWDPAYLIESLSDSTIYPAYYAVAHLLQGDVYGSRPGELGIGAEQVTAAVWDMVLLGAPYDAACGIPEEKIVRMRREFTYWLPCNLRVSGKDLIPNHLSFYLYTHTAVFPEDKWPLGVRANGHLMLNGRPMSKSKGNFLTLHDACKTYSADAVRLALADAGDGLDDANFAESLANTAVTRLAGQLEWTRAMLAALPTMRTAADRLEGDVGAVAAFADATFDAEMDRAITEAKAACEATQFKAALRHGFFDLQAARDRYVNTCGTLAVPLRRELVSRFMEVQALLLSVFCPHTAEQMWADLGHTTSVLRARYPAVKSAVDEVMLAQSAYVQQLLHNARERLTKFTTAAPASKKPEVAVFCVATKQPSWQRRVIEIMHQAYRAEGGKFANESVGAYFKGHADLQPHMKDLMAFALELREDARRRGEEAFLLAGASFAEDELIRRLAEYIRRVLQVREVRVLQHGEAATGTRDADDAAANPRRVPRPGKPSITFVCAQ